MGVIGTGAGVIAIVVVTHFKLPVAWRKDADFRRRLRWHHVAQLYILVISVQYWIFSVLFFLLPLNIQWVLAIAMTIVREGNVKILTSVCNKVAAKRNDNSVELIVSSLVTFYHISFLSVCMATLSTDATNYVLLALDFSCNMYGVLGLYQSAKKSEGGGVGKSGQLVVVGQSLGIIIPLSFLACLAAVYHGPNAVNLGNVKSDYFQWQKIDDFGRAVFNLLIFVFFDIFSSIITCLVVNFTCRVNLLKVWVHVLKEFGMVLAIHQAYMLDTAFCQVEIACALDFTFKFDWWLNRDAWLNSTIHLVNATSLL